MQLIKTATNKSTRYYINGKRVSFEQYDEARDYGRMHSMQTVKIKNGYRHSSSVNK